MHWLPRPRVGPTRRRVLSLSSARLERMQRQGAWSLSSSVEWLKNDDWHPEALRSLAVNHPASFRWHASSKKKRPTWCLRSFRMSTILPWRTAWIADILSEASLHDVQDNTVGNVVAETGRDFATTARLSDHSMPFYCVSPLKAEVRRLPEPSARPLASTAVDSEERQICTVLLGESVGLRKDDGLILSTIVEHTSAREWVGDPERKRKGLTCHPAVKHQSPAAKATNSKCCDRAVVHVKQHIPEQPGWKNSKYWVNFEKRNQINTKTMSIGNWKGDCAWNCSRYKTQSEKIFKLQSTNQFNVRSEWH